MALSTDIYARFAPKSVADFDREAYANEGAQQVNALRALALQDAQRSTQRQNALQQLTQGWGAGTTDDERTTSLRNRGFFSEADALEKSMLGRREAVVKIEKDRAETAAKTLGVIRDGLGYVMSNPTRDGALSAIDRVQQLTGADMSRYRAEVAGFQTPDEFKRWAAGHSLAIDKQVPSFDTVDTGGAQQTLRRDPVTGVVTVASTVAKTQSPDNLATNSRIAAEGAANRAVTMRGQNLDQAQPRGQIVQTDQGVLLVNPRTGEAMPVNGPDGRPLGPKLRDVPAPVRTAMLENATNLRRAEQALALVEGKRVGDLAGDTAATGLKGYLPNQVLNRIDPAGVDARAAIADLGSLVIHDRSGAAVTAAEFPRLAPFIPTEKDDAATVQKKLKRFVQVYREELQASQSAYGPDAGYRGMAPGAEPAQRPSGAPQVVDFGDLK